MVIDVLYKANYLSNQSTISFNNTSTVDVSEAFTKNYNSIGKDKGK